MTSDKDFEALVRSTLHASVEMDKKYRELQHVMLERVLVTQHGNPSLEPAYARVVEAVAVALDASRNHILGMTKFAVEYLGFSNLAKCEELYQEARELNNANSKEMMGKMRVLVSRVGLSPSIVDNGKAN